MFDDVLYTMVPPTTIFGENSDNSSYEYQDISFNGIQMQVETMEWNRARIIRLYSTDPSHYLDPTLQPGNIIKL